MKRSNSGRYGLNETRRGILTGSNQWERYKDFWHDMPWWVFLVSLVICFSIYRNSIAPDLTPRTWNIPRPQDIKFVYGYLTNQTYSYRRPFSFTVDDKELLISCWPELPGVQCIADPARLEHKTAKIGYYTTFDRGYKKNVMVSMYVGTSPIVSESDSLFVLAKMANLEDQKKSHIPWFSIGMFTMLVGIFLSGFAIRLGAALHGAMGHAK